MARKHKVRNGHGPEQLKGGERVSCIPPVAGCEIGRVGSKRFSQLGFRLGVTLQHHDDIAREEHPETLAFDQVAETSWRVTRRPDHLDECVSKAEAFIAMKRYVHGRRVRRVVGHVERAEEDLGWFPGFQYPDIAHPRVDSRPCCRP